MTTKFLCAEDYNAMTDTKRTNCLAFAFGQTVPENCTYCSNYNLDRVDCDECYITITQSFLWKARHFGLNVHEVTKITALVGKTGFLVFGFYRDGDFHVVRHNADGSWEHKPDWKEPAQRVELDALFDEYPERYHIFVLDEE